MSNSRAPLLLLLAVGMLVLAALDEPLVVLVSAFGFGSAADRIVPVMATSLAASGFVLLLVALAGNFRGHSTNEVRAPYAAALKAFAAEFGRGVSDTPDGLAIHLVRDGQRVDVELLPGPRGRLEVRSPPPARQSLAWMRPSAPRVGAAADWREVESTDVRVMYAELTAMARPLLGDAALVAGVSDFFATAEAESIVHTLSGVVIRSRVPAVENVADQVRLCTELAFLLRRVNG